MGGRIRRRNLRGELAGCGAATRLRPRNGVVEPIERLLAPLLGHGRPGIHARPQDLVEVVRGERIAQRVKLEAQLLASEQRR